MRTCECGYQPRNAARVAALGAGIALDGPAGLGDAVRRLLEDGSYRAAAARVAAEVAALPSVDDAPALLGIDRPRPASRVA